MATQTYSSKRDEDTARQRLQAFWAGESLGRPALHAMAQNPAYKETPWPGPELSPLQRDLNPAWHAWQLEERARSRLWLGEAMPCHQLDWGSCLVTLAVLAGGSYEYHDSAWILEIPDLYKRPLPEFSTAHPAAQRMTTCYTTLKSRIGDRGFITPPLMCDGLTTLSLLRTPALLGLDMLEQPGVVKAWSGALTTMYMEIYEHYYQLLGYGESTCFGGPLAPGRTEAVQCDFAVMLSPAMFEEFVLPDLRRVTDYQDHSLYHLDGTCQMRFLDHLASLPKLNGIQWNPETTAGSSLSWLAALRAIRQRHLSLFISCSVEEAIALTKELGPDGLYLVLPVFDTPEAADAAIHAIEKAC